MRGKPECGIEEASHLDKSRNWGLQRGVVMATRCWEPVGHRQFVSSLMEERIAEERKLWEAIPNVPDLQCAWQILLQSANPRVNHTIRTLPPSNQQIALIGTTRVCGPQCDPCSGSSLSSALATLPMRMGGLGLRSASRCARAAYWASWSDTLHMIHQRTPEMAELVVEAVCQEERPGASCLGQLQDAAAQLERGRWRTGPS